MSNLLLLALLIVGVAVAPGPATGAESNQMYLLVRQWSPTYCEDRTCVSGQDPELMTIHGLWPTGQRYDDDRVSYCTREKFSTSALTETTLARMNCAWPSATGTNKGFWAHEWEKHGTCAAFSSQEGYFNATLNANDRYDLNVAFTEAGISFSGGNDSPTTSQMEEAMRDAFGIGGQVVKCKGDNLYEIMMCLDWNSLEAFECDESFWNTCGRESDRVTFPEGSGEEAATCSKSYKTVKNGGLSGVASAGVVAFLLL